MKNCDENLTFGADEVLRYRSSTLSLLQADNAFRRLILPSIVMGCREQGSLYLRCVASGNIVQSVSVHR